MKNIIDFFKGLFMGAACAVPGIPNSIFRGKFNKGNRKNFIFMPIALGFAVGLLLISNVISWVCEFYTGPAYALFTGLMLGSVPMLINKIRKSGFYPSYLIFSAFFAVLIVFISILSNDYSAAFPEFAAIKAISGIKDAAVIFTGGMFFCSLPVISGISGSGLLLSLNQYGNVFYAFSNIFSKPDCIPVIIIFISGSLTGFLVVMKFLEWVREKYLYITYYIAAGVIIGGVFSLLYNGLLNFYAGVWYVSDIIAQSLIFAGFAALGFLIVRRLIISNKSVRSDFRG